MGFEILRTDRLKIRQWEEKDILPFTRMNQNPEVMRHFPSLLSAADSLKSVERYARSIEALGYGYFAIERLEEGDFIGFIGFMDQTYESPFTPAIDIGWRLKPEVWGKGYATEGALACMRFAKEEFHFHDIISVATSTNKGSHRVMQKLGMQQIGSFDHPKIPDNSVLKECWVFK